MVLTKANFKCVTVVLVEFSCLVSYDGPTEPAAKGRWNEAITYIYRLRGRIQILRGTVLGQPCTMVLLIGEQNAYELISPHFRFH